MVGLLAGADWHSPSAEGLQNRIVRIVNTSAGAGQNVSVVVELLSQGNENALGFSLNFDASVFGNPSAALGSGASGATLNVNTLQSASGRIGIALALPSGQSFAAGTRQLVVITFAVAANAVAGQSAITFGDLPIARETSDPNANALMTAYTAGVVTIVTANPLPELIGLNPASVIAGTGTITLTLNGSGFVPLSSVRWNGAARSSTFVNDSQLTANIPASDLVLAGIATVTVVNPSPGGGTSNSLNLAINNPSPMLNSINPNSATAGGSAFNLTVNGANFVNGSVVQWNGNQRTTSFINAMQLTAAISDSDIAAAGSVNITVKNPAPGGGVSSAQTFVINQTRNPIPAITNLNPVAAIAGGNSFALTINGANFVNSSVVRWNGDARTTAFVSVNQLTAMIPATDITTAGVANVTVFNPAPGGGESNGLPFNTFNPLATVSAASFLGGQLAPESIVAAFGANLATAIEIGNTVPLPTMLAGTKVMVKDSSGDERLSPLFFVAPNQINYLIPAGTVNGAAAVTVNSGDNKISVGTVQIASVAPGLFTANSNGAGVPAATIFRLKPNGESVIEPLARFDSSTNRFVAIPIDLGPETEQVFVVLFGTGFRFNGGLSGVGAQIGGVNSEVLFAGPQGDFVGLDQCNVRIPRSLNGRGEVELALTVNGQAANIVRISIK